MTPERWQQVEEVLQAALDRPPQERAAYLDEACAGDEELKDEASQLITAHMLAGDFIEEPAIAQDARVLLGDEPDVDTGRQLGPYRIVERLGEGGMGEVYLAEDARLKRRVALKILQSYFASNDERLRRFQREARAASALSHPNILTIYEVGEAEGVHFIAAEFIDGQTLRERIALGDLSLEEILDIGLQVASALAAAHAAGIIHRDIKPENIMRRADRLVKILDFGIAKLTEQRPPLLAPADEISSEAPTLIRAQTEAGVMMGTIGYMSPEQARGLHIDERTDIWSLGVVLYEMLRGTAPFQRATRVDTFIAVLEREPAPLLPLTKDAPPDAFQKLERIIGRALSKERSERYESVTEMLEDLKSVSREVSLTTPANSAFLRLVREAPHEGGDGGAKAFAAKTATSSQSATASEDDRAATRQAQRRILKALIVVSLLFAIAIVTYLYNRSVARRVQIAGSTATSPTTTKLYRQMSEAEQFAFISQQEQRISAQMGDQPARLNQDALRIIKAKVDAYVARLRRDSTEPGRDDLRVIYARAVPYVPHIARSFAANKVPLLVGLYLAMIESEYRPCAESSLGAKGIFQFTPQTAKLYGVAPDEMCEIEKMAPAAARYIADRMAELGDDAESMTLVILSYNRGPEWVRDTLRQLRDIPDYERNFWTLFSNRDKLDESFRRESAGYIPQFFAAAIIGENPQNFELQTPPLSTLAETSAPARP